MKNDTTYGLIRHVDELGRIVVPKEIRKQLNISETDAVEISVSGRSIVIKNISRYRHWNPFAGTIYPPWPKAAM